MIWPLSPRIVESGGSNLTIGTLVERGGSEHQSLQGSTMVELALVAGARFIGENSVSSLNNNSLLNYFYTFAASHTK